MKKELGGMERATSEKGLDEKKLSGILDKFIDSFYGKLSFKGKIVVLAALAKVFSPDAALAGDVKVENVSGKSAMVRKADKPTLPPSMLQVLRGVKGFSAEDEQKLRDAISQVKTVDVPPTSSIPSGSTRGGGEVVHADPDIDLFKLAKGE